MVGLRIAGSVTWIMGSLGVLVDGWEGWSLFRRYHTRAGEQVSLGAIAGSIVKSAIILGCRDRGRKERELMVRIEGIGG